MRKTLVLLICAFILGVPTFSFGACPVVHVLLAQRWLDCCVEYSADDRMSFMVGTLVPDIRYLGVVDREETHVSGVRLEEVLEASSPFESGMRFHAFVDEERERFVLREGVYQLLPAEAGDFPTTFLKLVEDEVAYDLGDWDFIFQYLFPVHSEELALGLPYNAVDKWHLILMKYFFQRPSVLLEELANSGRGLWGISSEQAALWSRILPTLAQDTYFVEYVGRLIAEFDALFCEVSPKSCNRESVTSLETGAFIQ